VRALLAEDPEWDHFFYRGPFAAMMGLPLPRPNDFDIGKHAEHVKLAKDDFVRAQEQDRVKVEQIECEYYRDLAALQNGRAARSARCRPPPRKTKSPSPGGWPRRRRRSSPTSPTSIRSASKLPSGSLFHPSEWSPVTARAIPPRSPGASHGPAPRGPAAGAAPVARVRTQLAPEGCGPGRIPPSRPRPGDRRPGSRHRGHLSCRTGGARPPWGVGLDLGNPPGEELALRVIETVQGSTTRGWT
jgi:hypothetical protein